MERLIGWPREQSEYMCCQCQSCGNCSSVHVSSLSNRKPQRCGQSSVRQVFHAIVTVHVVIHVTAFVPVLAFIIELLVIFVSLQPEVYNLLFTFISCLPKLNLFQLDIWWTFCIQHISG